MTETEFVEDALVQTTEIVAAFVAHNSVGSADLPALIRDVHAALMALSRPAAAASAEPQAPVIPSKKSVTPDFIICLEDGKKFKSLKRHLATHHQLTPDGYRAKWGLATTYPMVAPNYSSTRSALAKSTGLGRKTVTDVSRKGRPKVSP